MQDNHNFSSVRRTIGPGIPEGGRRIRGHARGGGVRAAAASAVSAAVASAWLATAASTTPSETFHCKYCLLDMLLLLAEILEDSL
jgi:hypothetical protein